MSHHELDILVLAPLQVCLWVVFEYERQDGLELQRLEKLEVAALREAAPVHAMCHRGKVFGRHEVLFDSGHGRRRQVQCVGRRSDRDHCGGRGGTVGPRRTGTCRRGLVAAGMNGRLGRGWGCRVDGCCLHRLGRMVGADLGEERGDARRLGHAGLGSGDDQETDVEDGGSPVIATKAPTQNGSTTPTHIEGDVGLWGILPPPSHAAAWSPGSSVGVRGAERHGGSAHR